MTKAERTKQFILETAAPIYNQKGVSGVGIDDVLMATQLTKGCLYGHFESKEDLSDQVVDLMLEKITGKIYQTIALKKTAKEKLFAFMDFYKNPMETYITGGCPIFNTAVDADDNYPGIKQKIAALFKKGQKDLVHILQEGIRNGEFTAKLDPAVYAFKLVAAIEGGTVMCKTMDTVKPMQALIKSLKAELMQYET